MYTPIASGGALAFTGTAMVTQDLWFVVGAFVIGGAAVAANRFGPRIAFEPIRQEKGGYRIQLTKNGRPWRRNRRH